MFENPKTNLQLFLTRRCQLRCSYCPVDKSDRDMSPEVLQRGVELLLTHASARVRLDFSGGEPLLRFDLLREALRYGQARARACGKSLSFYLVTNAVAMSARVAEALAPYDLYVNLSLDGAPESTNRHRLARRPGNLDPYREARRGIDCALRAGLNACGVLVTTPDTVHRLAENVDHLYGLGLRGVEINYAIGRLWTEARTRMLLEQLGRVLETQGPALSGGERRLGNLEGRVEPAALNAELMVDCDGTLHLLSEWLFETTPGGTATAQHLGDVFGVRDINSLYWDSFSAYHGLVRRYSDNERVRRILLNNISLGERVGRFFAQARARIHGGPLVAS